MVIRCCSIWSEPWTVDKVDGWTDGLRASIGERLRLAGAAIQVVTNDTAVFAAEMTADGFAAQQLFSRRRFHTSSFTVGSMVKTHTMS